MEQLDQPVALQVGGPAALQTRLSLGDRPQVEQTASQPSEVLRAHELVRDCP